VLKEPEELLEGEPEAEGLSRAEAEGEALLLPEMGSMVPAGLPEPEAELLLASEAEAEEVRH
jgi:hypothetical protein